MRLETLQSRRERAKRESEWHRWFAWYPVVMKSYQHHEWIWLEPLSRKRGAVGGNWIYRLREGF